MKQPLVDRADVVARINVTPIIDVALVLVIILLITAPMITALNMELDLPQAKTRSVEDEVRLSISLSKLGELALDDELVPPGNLSRVLARKFSEKDNENILVIIRADAAVPHQTVRQIIEDAKGAGAKRIAIATRQRGVRKP